MDILNIVEASPLPKHEVVAMFGMDLVRYYRWQKKYYFTNCLEDKRGAKKKLRTLKDIYRSEHKLARYCHPQTLGKLERYHRTLRVECLRHFEFDDPLEAIKVIKDYNRKYNYERKHQGIGRVTPEDRYTGKDKEIKRMRMELRKKVREERRLQNLTEEQIVETIAIKEIAARWQPFILKQEELAAA